MKRRSIRLSRAVSTALLAITAIPQSAIFAADGTWTDTVSNTWNNTVTASWSGGVVADGANFTANFNNDIPIDEIVTLNAVKTIGNLNFADAGTGTAFNWILTGSTLTLSNTTTPTITVGSLGLNRYAQISSILAGTQGMTKAGAGTLLINTATTYTGTTTVNEGTLIANASLASSTALVLNTATASTTLRGGSTVGAITMAANTGANTATISPGSGLHGLNQIATITTTGLTVNGGVFNMDLATTTSRDLINLTSGSVNFAGASTININGNPVAGTYSLITATTPITYGVTPTIVDPIPSARSFSVTQNTSNANAYQVDIVNGALALTWSGATAAWDINTSSNFNAGAQTFFNRDSVTFDDTGTNKNVTVAATVIPAAVTFNNSTGNNYSLSGAGGIGGFASVTKAGTGKATISTTSTYTGGTTINRGELSLDFSVAGAPTNNILSSGGNVALNNAATLSVVGAAGGTNSQTFASTSLNTGYHTISAQNGAGGTATLNLGYLLGANSAAANITGPQIGTAIKFVGPATQDAAGSPVAATGTIIVDAFGGGGGGALGATGTPSVSAQGQGYGTVGLYDYAAVITSGANAGQVIGGSQVAGFYTTTYPNNTSSNANFDMTANTTPSSGGAQKSTGTIRFNTPTATIFTSNTSNLVTNSAFLITPNMGANNSFFNGPGNWQIVRTTSNGSQNGLIWQNNTQGFFNVAAFIIDGRQGTSTPSSITKAGPGTLNITQTANSYTGGSYLYEGATLIAADGSLGAATGTVRLNGGSLGTNTASVTMATRPISIVGAANLFATTGNVLSVGGVISDGAGGAQALAIGTGTIAGTGVGTANVTALNGNGVVEITNGANTYTKGTTVQNGGILRINNTSGTAPLGTGALTVNSGTVAGTGNAATASTFNSGGRLSPGTPGVLSGIGSITLGSTIMNTGSGFDLDLAPATNDVFNLSDWTISSGMTVNLFSAGTASPYASNGTFTVGVVTGTKPTAGSLNSNITIANPASGGVYTWGVTGNNITLDISGLSVSGQWALATGGSWATTAPANWTSNPSVPSTQGDVALFGGNLTTSGTVTVDGALTVGTVAFNNAVASYTVATGTGSLTLNNGAGSASISNGNGTHTLAAATTLLSDLGISTTLGSGLTTISGAITGATKNVTFSGSGKTILTANNTWNDTSIGSGTVELGNGGTTGTLGTGNTNFTGTATLRINNSSITSIATNITGSGGTVIKDTASTLTLSGANTFGGLTVNSGQVIAGSATAIPTNVTTALTGGSLEVNGNSVTLGTLTGTSNITNTTATAVTVNLDQTANSTYSGSIVQSSGVINFYRGVTTGNNTLTLTAPQTYTGTTTIDRGRVEVATGATLGNATNGITVYGNTGGGITVSGGTLTSGGAFQMSPGSVGLNVTAGTVNINGPINVYGVAHAPNTASQNDNLGRLLSISGGTVTAQSIQMGRDNGFTTEPATGSATNGVYITGGTVSLTLNSSTVSTLNVGLGQGAVSQNSSASFRMDGGTVTVAGKTTVGLNNGGRWSILDFNGGTFTSNDTLDTGAFEINYGISVGGNATGNSTVRIRGTSVVKVPAIYTGEITAGSGNIRVEGGTLYLGDTTDPTNALDGSQPNGILDGIVEYSPGVSGSTFTTNIFFASGTVGASADWQWNTNNIYATGFSSTTSIIQMTGDAVNGITIKAADDANVAHNITLGGVLTGTGALTKTGGGTLLLTAANSYSGLTNVNGGTLAINGQWALGGAVYGGMTFNGGTLKYDTLPGTNGTGDITRDSTLVAKNVTINAGGATVDTNGFSMTYTSTIGNSGTGGLTKAGTGTLTLAGGQTYTGATTVNAGTLEVTGAHNGNHGNYAVNTAGTLKVSTGGVISATGTPAALTVAGAGVADINGGQATFSSVNGTNVSVQNNGVLTIAALAPTPIASANKISNLTIATGGVVDIKNNALLLASTDTTDAARDARWAQVLTGQNNFDNNGQVTWDGPGLVSSTARTNNLGLGVDAFVIGVASNHDLAKLSVDGGAAIPYDAGNPWLGTVSSVGADDILIRMTYAGDTNLDGTVTIDDYNNIDGTFTGLLPTNYGWVSGDFDFNGAITIDDYNAIDSGFLYQGGQLTQGMIAARTAMFGADYVAHLEAVAAAFASVPEPTTVGMLAVGAMGLLSRRRRKA